MLNRNIWKIKIYWITVKVLAQFQTIWKYKIICSYIILLQSTQFWLSINLVFPRKISLEVGGFGYSKNILGMVNFGSLSLSFLIIKLRKLEKSWKSFLTQFRNSLVIAYKTITLPKFNCQVISKCLLEAHFYQGSSLIPPSLFWIMFRVDMLIHTFF